MQADDLNRILGEPVSCPEDVAGFAPEKHENRFRVVAIGDSITQCTRWEREKRWPTILENTLGDECIVLNAGIGGTSSSLGLFRWERDVVRLKPHCVIMNFLLNDSHIRHYEYSGSYCVQCSRERMCSNLCTMIQWGRVLGAEPILWTPPPVPKFPEAYKSEAHCAIQSELLEHYRAEILRIAHDLKVPLADFWSTLPELVDEYPGPYFNRPDGYHSNDLSQPILADGIARLLKPIFQGWQR